MFEGTLPESGNLIFFDLGFIFPRETKTSNGNFKNAAISPRKIAHAWRACALILPLSRSRRTILCHLSFFLDLFPTALPLIFPDTERQASLIAGVASASETDLIHVLLSSPWIFSLSSTVLHGDS